MSAGVLRTFGAALEQEGVPVSALLSHAGIPPQLYEQDEARVNIEAAWRFITAAGDTTRQPALGLRAARLQDVGKFHLLEYLAASSADVEAAVDTLIRHQQVITARKVFALEEYPEGRLIRYQPRAQVPRCLEEFAIGCLASISKRVVGPAPNASGSTGQVWFEFPEPTDSDAYRDYFGQAVVFGAPATGILVHRECLKHAMQRANAPVRMALERQALESRYDPIAEVTYTERVRAELQTQLAGTPPSLSAIATRLHVSASTLKRKLTEEGSGYRTELDQLRHHTALRLLGQGDLSIGEVAYQTGYQDLSAFYRAFRRWTGRSPSDYGRSHA